MAAPGHHHRGNHRQVGFARLPSWLGLAFVIGRDERLAFLQQPQGDPSGSDPLVEELANWLGRERPISILDFSGVPAQASELAIGVILNLLREAAVRTRGDGAGIGRPRPLLVLLEEAHRYLGGWGCSNGSRWGKPHSS